MTGDAEQDVAASAIAANLAAVRERIAAAARSVGRPPVDITLVAVGKAQPEERVRAALAAGQRTFGENYMQEARARWPALRERHPDLRLHMIGPIQSNKAKDVIALFDVIETLDRPKLAAALAREMARQDRRPACFVQVNTGEEPQKAGVWPADADGFIRACRDDLGLPVTGLMAIPPEDEEPSLHFALLAKIAARNRLSQLSMGMSADFEIAVQFGATHVRVGSAIFGARPPKAAPPGQASATIS
ncbi:MAG TPA: YggS family pyridoxal phosphate-dependent enzyme [Geminicoccaceae bacterium]|nr:YggS family pyridoxal phosphate-dependent enzyme [Geminicoccaceae bacterium]